jgi:transcriptional regulator with XRE-family HTH domain
LEAGGMDVELTFWEWTEREGYSIRKLAKKMKYSPAYLSRIKHGKVPVTIGFVSRCIAVFGAEVKQFCPEYPQLNRKDESNA